MRRLTVCLLGICSFVSLAEAQQVVQQRGADQQVRYDALVRYGPWDDRNYQLTRADLALLAPNEDELRDPIPAFFRVLLRKNHPGLPREGPAQYPRSALQIYLQEYGGYLVNNRLYSSATVENGQFRVVESEGTEVRGDPAARLLVGEVRVTSPSSAAESAIKVNPVDQNLVIAGSNGPGGGQVMHFSDDGGETWATAALPLGGTCCDPTVDWSSDGSLAYAATLGNCTTGSLCSIWFYRSADNGQTWTDLQTVTPGDPRRELTNTGSDKEYLHVDKHPASPCLDNVYLTWHVFNVLQFARSTDNGNTWATTSFTADAMGIGSDVTTDRNGRIYYFWPGTNTSEIVLKRSTDCGASFDTGTIQIAATNGAFDFPIPSIETRRAWIHVSADADLSSGPFSGSIYAAWTDTTGPESATPANNHTRIQVAFSRDNGATWTIVTPHETADQDTVDRWNQWLAVGPDGRVHVVFYDTRNSTARSGVDLYYSFSTNGAQSFSTPRRLTSETSANLSDAFEFGDYNGLDHLTASDAIAIFTDNRQEGTGSGDSKDVYAARSVSNLSNTFSAKANGEHGFHFEFGDRHRFFLESAYPITVNGRLTYEWDNVRDPGPSRFIRRLSVMNQSNFPIDFRLRVSPLSLDTIQHTVELDTTSSVAANDKHGFHFERRDQHAFYLVSVYPTTVNGRVTYEWDNVRDPGGSSFIRRLTVINKSSFPVEFKLKVVGVVPRDPMVVSHQ